MSSHALPPAALAVQHVLLVGSGGGHLTQLIALRPWWQERRRTWVTFDTTETRSRLPGERVLQAHGPTTRSIPALLRNLLLALRVLPRLDVDLVVSTGAGVALPFFLVARALGLPCVYIEVVDRLDTPTLTGRLCYPLSSVFLVQWPQQLRLYPRAQVLGTLI